MLNQRGFYLFKREDGSEVKMLFRTWTFQRFSEINGGLSYQQMIEMLTTGFGIKQMADLILCAAEYVYLKESRPFPYTNIDACEWIDEMGGLSGNAFLQVIKTATDSLTDSGAPQSEKKMEIADQS